MVKAEQSVEINLPVNQVFAYVGTGYGRNLPSWASNLRSWEQTSTGTIGVGTTFRQVRTVRGKDESSNVRITSFEKNRMFAFEDDSPSHAKGTYLFEPKGDATKVTLSIEIQPPGLGKLAAPMVQREMGKSLETDLTSLKTAIESF